MMEAFARLFPPCLAVSLMLVLASPCSLANQLEDDDATASDDAPEPAFGEQVVVTATGIETPVAEVGSTITVLTSEEMRQQQRRTVADALTAVPGVDVRRTGGPGAVTSVFLRGMDSDHTLVLVDGIELNDPSSPNRAAFLDHLTLDNVERIEVLRGPQSTLYGSDAIGGVINIISKRGQGDPAHELWAEGGRYSTLRAGFSSAGGSERFDYSVSGSYTDTDSFSARSVPGQERDPYRSGTVAGLVGFDSGDGFEIDLVFRHLDAESDFDSFVAEPGNLTDTRQSMVKIEPRLSLFDGRWQQRWILRTTRHERDTTGDFPSLAEGQLSGVEWRNDLTLNEKHTLTLGADGAWEKGEFGGFSSFDDGARLLGLYAQDQWKLGERWSGTVGVRVDDHDSFGSEATYRVAGSFRIPGSGTTLRASGGTGFKAPSISELHDSDCGNPALNPETSLGFDLGVEQRWANRRVSAGATLFRNRIDNLILAEFDPNTFACLGYSNLDEAETRGVETFAHLEPVTNLEIRVSYTYTDTEAKGDPAGFLLSTGSRLLLRPEHKGHLGIHQRLAGGVAGITLDLLYVGKRDDPTGMESDEYWLANLAGSWNLTDRLQLLARVENLFDEDYEDVIGFNTAGASGFLGVRVGF
jgi:vitamin B12 transporter